MLEDYILAKKDFEAIEGGIKIAHSEKMRHAFPRGLGDLDLVSYDSKFIHLWSRNNYPNLKKLEDSVCQFKLYHFPHNLTLADGDYEKISLTTGGIKIGGKIFKNLPDPLNIQCAPLTARTKLRINQYNVPVERTSHEEAHYSAIVVHEFGHFYFDQNTKDPLPRRLLHLTKPLAKVSEAELEDLLNPLNLDFLSELFATLVELEVLKIFYPTFLEEAVRGMNLYVRKKLDTSPQERKILLAKDDHLYAKILAPHIFKSFPNWPEKFHKLI